MTSIQSQLDQVLAPCPFCGSPAKLIESIGTGEKWNGPSWKVCCTEPLTPCVGGFINLWQCTPEDAIAAWNKRAAVGGEAVNVDAEARRLFELNSAGWAVKARWDELHPQTRELWHAHALKSLNHPATVDVGALRELHFKYNQRSDNFAFNNLLGELAALIGKEA